jgi:hypothetical protein
MEQVNWKPVHEYDGLYEINVKGEVRSLHKRNYHEIMPQRIDRGGYYTVRLSKKGKDSTKYVHRLLGFGFIPNPDNKPFINHKDTNKLNNALENLEWVTHAENMKHAYENGAIRINSKAVVDLCTGQEFPSAKEAAAFYGINDGTLRNYLNGNIKHNPTCLQFKNIA